MNLLLFIIFGSILLGILVYIFSIRSKWVICLGQFTLFLVALYQFIEIRTTDSRLFTIGGWTEGKGISLYIDTLASAMILLATFLFILFFVYEWKKLVDQLLFVLLLFLIQGLLCALFVSHDLFNIFVLMEVSTVLVTLLIVFKKNPVAYYDGLIYLLINIVGMSFFLLGVGYIYKLYGIYDLTQLSSLITQSKPDGNLLITYALLMTGISFKVGVMPVFSWLPKAHGSYGAPSVVSAILSGLYINIGFLYFIKFQRLFAAVLDTSFLFLIIGFATALTAGILALVQNDIKRMLAYSTASQVGFILMGLNLPYEEAFYGSIYHIFSHSIFKALLFLSCGTLVEHFGTRNMDKIHGVLKKMPIIGISIIAGILGITGAPFFNGSIGKYLISKASGSFVFEWLLYALAFVTIVYLARFSLILFGSGKAQPIYFHQKLVITILGLLCLLGGLYAPIWMKLLFGYELSIEVASYSVKSIIYLVSVLLGFILYFTKIRYSILLKRIREIDIPFNLIVLTIVILFIMLLVGSFILNPLISIA